MKYRSLQPLLFLLLPTLLLGGCASAKESEEGPRTRRDRATRAQQFVSLDLRAASDDVRTVQFYLGDDERQLPVLSLTRGGQAAPAPEQQLTLEFDLLGEQARPLSAYFYHADRRWRRDLMPVEYLESFQRDELLDHRSSTGTVVPYTHYTYRFPNQNISFRLSGNYILRVTEQGDEDAVLFERPFFVTEQQAGSFEMGLDNVLVGGQGSPSIAPAVRFLPPPSLQGSVYDYNVCFVRNAQYEHTRCADRASLLEQPLLHFYLEPELAFEPQAADYFLDLGAIQVGGQIEATDRMATPYAVTLEPDYARFPGTPLAPSLNGQAVVEAAVRDVYDPDLTGEYVQVGFSYVPPDEQPLAGRVAVVGSFNNWTYDEENELTWVDERGRYEGTVLLKQGQYEYRYASPDRPLEASLHAVAPGMEDLYMAFVYYNDLSLNTDRLLAVGGATTR